APLRGRVEETALQCVYVCELVPHRERLALLESNSIPIRAGEDADVSVAEHQTRRIPAALLHLIRTQAPRVRLVVEDIHFSLTDTFNIGIRLVAIVPARNQQTTVRQKTLRRTEQVAKRIKDRTTLHLRHRIPPVGVARTSV